ncbi:MAG: UDP-N-acetylmuramate dehydrogenase [Acidobacteria bacterium]|nr:UDP-N-acetylmuramate dehydrogenase [Acidobacteriota bacterium]
MTNAEPAAAWPGAGAALQVPAIRAREPLAPYTTFRIGGAADWFCDAPTAGDLRSAVAAATGAGVPVTVLGGGSNVLIGDGGVRGLVVRPRERRIELVRPGIVRASAGVTLNGLVRWTIGRGLAGLEGWAGTPGTVGGAVYGNAHFRDRLLSEVVAAVGMAAPDGTERVAPADAMAFGYDASRLQQTGEVALWVEFAVAEAEPAALRARAREALAYRKRTQPLSVPSAGCVFRNPEARDSILPADVPASAGALIDRAGLKGTAIGSARVSERHANFIVAGPGATARDVRALVDLCRVRVEATFGVLLRREVVYLGEFS